MTPCRGRAPYYFICVAPRTLKPGIFFTMFIPIWFVFPPGSVSIGLLRGSGFFLSPLSGGCRTFYSTPVSADQPPPYDTDHENHPPLATSPPARTSAEFLGLSCHTLLTGLAGTIYNTTTPPNPFLVLAYLEANPPFEAQRNVRFLAAFSPPH